MERVAPLLLETSKSGPYFYVWELPHHTHTHTHCIFHFPAPLGSLPLSYSPALTASLFFFCFFSSLQAAGRDLYF